jgi:hypothetical protein
MEMADLSTRREQREAASFLRKLLKCINVLQISPMMHHDRAHSPIFTNCILKVKLPYCQYIGIEGRIWFA